MEITRVFVYGTLMKGLSNYSVIKPFVKSICAGKTRGILYDLPYGYPAVKPGRGFVHGEVVELQDVAERLCRYWTAWKVITGVGLLIVFTSVSSRKWNLPARKGTGLSIHLGKTGSIGRAGNCCAKGQLGKL
ncbi:hypothetical protein SCFA_2650005 [anaerobic digester metagenome]|jgi:hypothetical protein|uniref:Gamma-glutamylcyclotransferase AIG2-like domain-containing protein n=1 Tax=anaerobic digester metagenome TaxID=1263854 RepID=A0A485LZU0_9ZZZZ